MTLTDAYVSSGRIFHQLTERYQPDLAEELKAIQKGEILVVNGDHDHVEQLLPVLKVPYQMVSTLEIPEDGKHRVAFVNCRQYDGGVPRKRLGEFVENGGRLVTTDWSLSAVTSAFPNHLHKVSTTPNDVVEIQCPTDLGRQFVGLHYAQCHPKWWLESSSHVYKIEEGVTPLITSTEMEAKYGQPYVAVGFSVGQGEVLHFISHFALQQTHHRSEKDKGNLEDFLKQMGAHKTGDMPPASVAELESAYSTLNTVAHLCSRMPLLGQTGGGKSVLMRRTKTGKESQSIL